MKTSEITFEGEFELEAKFNNHNNHKTLILDIKASYRGTELEFEEASDVPNYTEIEDSYFQFSAIWTDEEGNEFDIDHERLEQIREQVKQEVLERAVFN